MKEYIVEKKQTPDGWTWVEPRGRLIRCGECAHRKRFSSKTSYCDLIGKLHIGERDYCSWAERKEE